MSRRRECFFLDTSVLISNFFELFKDKLEKFFGIVSKYKIPCYISSSVERECRKKIKSLLEFIGESILLLKMRIAAEKTKEQHEAILMEPDILLVELLISDIFRELTEEAKLKGREPPQIEQNMLRTLEHSIVDFLEERFRTHASLSLDELDVFLAECLKAYVEIEDAFNLQLRSIAQNIPIDPDSRLVDEISKTGIPDTDSTHVASAIQYSISEKLSTVYVSLDYRHIINFQMQIYEKFKFQVSDPTYAFYHLRHEEAFKKLIELRKK